MAVKLPEFRPVILDARPQDVIDSFNIDRKKYPVVLLGIRGYDLDQGKKDENDRDLYDDAIFVDIKIMSSAGNVTACYSFNANTDPTKVKQGKGLGKTKGMFVLDPGVYYAHRIDRHYGTSAIGYPALAQWKRKRADYDENFVDNNFLSLCDYEERRKDYKTNKHKYDKAINEGKLIGHRDGGKKGGKNIPYNSGWRYHSINIHKGWNSDTGSAGCQTIHAHTQWKPFFELVTKHMKFIFEDNYAEHTIPYCLITNEQHKKILTSLGKIKHTKSEERTEVKKKAKEKKITDAKKKAETKKITDVKKKAETKKIVDAKKKAETKKIADAKKKTETKKIADAIKKAEAKKIADTKKKTETKKKADAKKKTETKKTSPFTLKKRSRGKDVIKLQKFLLNAGEDIGKDGADGKFGNSTKKAVKRYQKKKGFPQTGKVKVMYKGNEAVFTFEKKKESKKNNSPGFKWNKKKI